MTQFRKKPLLVDAVPVDDILESNPVPEWVTEALKEGDEILRAGSVALIPNGIDIVTKQGKIVAAGSGEWLLRAAPDDLWPIDGDVFEASYERPDVMGPTEFVVPEEAWRGEEPAPGTRRRLIFETIAGALTNDEAALALADDVEGALLGVEGGLGAEGDGVRPQGTSDEARGKLLEQAGPEGSAIAGRTIARFADLIDASGLTHSQREGTIFLTAVGVSDHAVGLAEQPEQP